MMVYAKLVKVITSGHMTKMAVTPVDPPSPKETLLHAKLTLYF